MLFYLMKLNNPRNCYSNIKIISNKIYVLLVKIDRIYFILENSFETFCVEIFIITAHFGIFRYGIYNWLVLFLVKY